jgi:hypothetical protein
VKKGQLDKNLRAAMTFVFDSKNVTNTTESQALLNLTGSDLDAAAQDVISDFFDANRFTGVTCDFGGIAMLVEGNRTITDDDSFNYDYDTYTILNNGPPVSCVD